MAETFDDIELKLHSGLTDTSILTLVRDVVWPHSTEYLLSRKGILFDENLWLNKGLIIDRGNTNNGDDLPYGTIRKNSDYFNFVAKVGMLLFISILSPDIIILDGLYNQ